MKWKTYFRFNYLWIFRLHKIQESGIQKREVNRIYMKKPTCHSKGSNFGSVGLIDCSGAFIIFGVGLALSFIIFIIELLVKRYKPNSNFKKVFPIEEAPEKWKNSNISDNEVFEYNDWLVVFNIYLHSENK